MRWPTGGSGLGIEEEFHALWNNGPRTAPKKALDGDPGFAGSGLPFQGSGPRLGGDAVEDVAAEETPLVRVV